MYSEKDDNKDGRAPDISYYRRTPEQLISRASVFWPSEISEKEAEMSIIPYLLQTQDNFLSILGVDTPDLASLLEILSASTMPGNLFLKHLMILSDVSGEMLNRISSRYNQLFPEGCFKYSFKSKTGEYCFKKLNADTALNNKILKVSGKDLFEKKPLDSIIKDVIALILFGASSTSEEVAEILAKCEIGTLLGRPEIIKEYVKQRYIVVSRITGGAKANILGQLAQKHVKEYLEKLLSDYSKVNIIMNGNIPGIVQFESGKRSKESSFDIVVEYEGKYVAIEVSFQVTTNSTIERKQGQAKSRYEQIKNKGSTIAYVIDGAGNFQRYSALETICNYSDCTVAFTDEELGILGEYMKGFFNLK